MKEDKKVEKVADPVVQEVAEVEVAVEPVIETQTSSYINRRKKSFEQEDSE